MRYRAVVIGVALSTTIWFEPALPFADVSLSPEESNQTIIVRGVTFQDGVITGELVNQSDRTLRDVQLQIRYLWQWKNEFRPGQDDYGTAVYYTLGSEIPPRSTVPFSLRTSLPTPSRPDGHFDIKVSVAGFKEIIL